MESAQALPSGDRAYQRGAPQQNGPVGPGDRRSGQNRFPYDPLPRLPWSTSQSTDYDQRYDLIMVDINAFIAVVMTDNNVVRNKIIRLPSDMNEPSFSC